MRSSLPGTRLRRLALALVAIIPILLTGAAPAAAAAPSNDDINGATAIVQLPLVDAVDMSQATWDFSTDSSACSFSQNHSVWYTFTPATSEQVAFDPAASNGPIAIDVFTGSPGALTRVGCGQGGNSGFNNFGFILDAVAGTEYWIMASTGCCLSSLPDLQLSVYLAVVPQATLSVTSGSHDQGGNATVGGTLGCTGTISSLPFNPPAVSGNVRQNVGRLSSVSATFATPVTCSPALRWTALAQPTAGKFVGGPVTVNASTRLCNLAGCATPSTTVIIKL